MSNRNFAQAPEPIVRRSARPTTIVWGIVLVIIGGGLITSQLVDVKIAPSTAFISMIALTGLLLVIGAVIGSLRSRRPSSSPPPTAPRVD